MAKRPNPPITDEMIAKNADALAGVVLALQANTFKLWPAMRSRWNADELTAALSAFSTKGDASAFKRLLE